MILHVNTKKAFGSRMFLMISQSKWPIEAENIIYKIKINKNLQNIFVLEFMTTN
jgi:hypothetical protein